jgi:endonuclease/exonuclease/phosphatase family metal-dependent hydrolase
MPVSIFNFGVKNMSWRGKIFAYLTIVFNLLLFFSYLAFLSDPTKNSGIAFLGLAYPILVTINLILFFIWFIKRDIFFFPTLILLILGMYHHSRFLQINPKISENNSYNEKIKVMSFNVRLFDLYNWSHNEEVKSKIIQLIKKQKPEIICFQEYFYDNNKEFITREIILKELGFEHYHESFTDESNKNSLFGLATFSKFPIINKGSLTFKNDHSNHCMWSDIVCESDTIRVFNTHLGSIRFNNSDYKIIGGKGSPLYSYQKIPKQDIFNRLKIGFSKRAQQITELVPYLKDSPFKRILCSDLNDTPISYAYNQLSNLFTDSFTKSGFGIGGTYIGKVPFLRIDYIWHDKDLDSFNFKTHQNQLSDHKAISVEILLR